MKHKVVISAGGQAFEFNGQIMELEEDFIVLKADKGDIYIERQYLVFIQFLEDTEEIKLKESVEPKPIALRSNKNEKAARFLKQRLSQDPLNKIIEEKLIPPSQFPDDEEYIEPSYNYQQQPEVDEDMEAMKNVIGHAAGPDHPFVKATNLRQAAKIAMQNEDTDFSMGNGSVEYKSPLQVIMGLKKNKCK